MRELQACLSLALLWKWFHVSFVGRKGALAGGEPFVHPRLTHILSDLAV